MGNEKRVLGFSLAGTGLSRTDFISELALWGRLSE